MSLLLGQQSEMPGGRMNPTFGFGASGYSPFSPEIAETISRFTGPISQFRPTADVNKAPYVGMLTTGNLGPLSLVDAPLVSIVIETQFAERAAALFDLVEIRAIAPGQKGVTYNIVHVGNSPFAETAALVPGPKGFLSVSEMKVTTNRYAHMMQIEAIALENTTEGARAWSLLEKQQLVGAVTTAASIIMGGLLDAVPAPLPFGVSDVSKMRYSSSLTLKSSIDFLINCFGALMHPRGLSFLMQIINGEKSARDISGKFNRLVTDEGAVTSLAHANNTNPNLSLDDAKSISEVAVLVERLLNLKIVEVGPLPIVPGKPSIRPFRTECKMLNYMLIRLDDNDRDLFRLRCYNRKDDIEEELMIPATDSLGGAVGIGWYIIIRPSTWDTSSGLVISDTNKPVLFLSRLFTKLGLNIQQLSLTQHSVFFGGFAVENPGGVLGVPNIKINGRISGDGVDFVPDRGFNPESGDFFSAKNGDMLLLPINNPTVTDPRKIPYLHPSGRFDPTVPGTHSAIEYKTPNLSERVKLRTLSVENTAKLSRHGSARSQPCFMLLDAYMWLKKSTVDPNTFVKVFDVPGNNMWGPGYATGMVSKMLGTKEPWKN